MWVRRRHVLALASSQRDDLWAFFAAVMVWGHGDVGYGATRTARILWSTRTRKVRANLLALIDASRKCPATTWDTLRTSHRTYQLGPAFGTKIAYFAGFSHTDPPVVRPLIADSNTSRSMCRLYGVSRSFERRDSYVRYVELAHGWAASKG